jgi:hypothetical protein
MMYSIAYGIDNDGNTVTQEWLPSTPIEQVEAAFSAWGISLVAFYSALDADR